MNEMQILLQYIYNQNQFYILYCHVFGDAPRITCHFTVLEEFKSQVINCLDGQAVKCPVRKQRVAGSIPGGDIYFHFEFFACFPS